MAAAAAARLVAWGARLRRGVVVGPVAASVAGVALAGAGVAWYHGLVSVAAPQSRLTVLAQVGTRLGAAAGSSDTGPGAVGGAGGTRTLTGLSGARGQLHPQTSAPPTDLPALGRRRGPWAWLRAPREFVLRRLPPPGWEVAPRAAGRRVQSPAWTSRQLR